jgi:hypothetical protein
MPQMVLQRNHVLYSTLGHSIAFEKGKPVGVPTSLVKQALSLGATLLEEEQKEDFLPQEAVRKSLDPQGDERETLVFDALRQLEERNDPLDFTAAGKPKFKVLTSKVGFRVDAEETADLWQKYKEMKASLAQG